MFPILLKSLVRSSFEVDITLETNTSTTLRHHPHARLARLYILGRIAGKPLGTENMPQAQYNLGHVAKLTAKSIGEPGSRHFQVAAEARNGQTVMIWMEKGQLFNLGVQVKRLLYEYQDDAERSSSEDSYQEAVFGVPDPPVLELTAGQMSIGYDRTSAMFFLEAHHVEQEDSVPLINLEATYREIDSLADQAFEVCAAGRPRCLLCGAPLDAEKHLCPRHNGHGVMAT